LIDIVACFQSGGGTPSDLAAEDLAGILRAVRETFWLDPDTEVTVEGRIRDFTMEKADAWVSAGANRFSLGLQTTDIPLRRRLGRFADRGEIVSVLNGLGETGALVIVDLIYGLPGQTENAVTEDIRFVAEETGSEDTDIPLSPAVCYWAPHMTNLLSKALSDFRTF